MNVRFVARSRLELTCIFILTSVTFGTAETNAQAPLATYIYAVEPADYRYLWYGELINQFDSASVQCQLGEISIVTNTNTIRVPLRLTQEQWLNEFQFDNYTAGQTSAGRDTTLEEYIRTETFALPNTSGVITFFRMATVQERTSHGEHRTSDHGPWPVTWRESQLALTKASYIEEETHFVVELVNVSDNVTLTIDSLKIPVGEPGRMLIAGEGSSLRRVQHTYQYPTSMLGDTVYLRWVPYRYGTKKVGVAARMTKSIVQISALQGDTTVPNTARPRWFNEAVSDSVFTIYATKMLEYQVANSASGCGRVVFGYSGLPPAIYAWYKDSLKAHGIIEGTYERCVDLWYADSAEIRATLCPGIVLPPKAREQTWTYVGPRMTLTDTLIIGKAVVHAFGDAQLCTLSIRDPDTKHIREIWTGSVPADIDVDVSGMDPGTYWLELATYFRGSSKTAFVRVRVEK